MSNMDQPPKPDKAVAERFTVADLVAYLQDELSDLREGWDQDFEQPPVGRPEDWKDQLAFIERAVAELEAGDDSSAARSILDSEIFYAQRALDGAALG